MAGGIIALFVFLHQNMNNDSSINTFFIRRIKLSGHQDSVQIPESGVPVLSFIYLSEGELTVLVQEERITCYPGQMLLIPLDKDYSLLNVNDAKGYAGGFSLSILPDANIVSTLNKPYLKVFWFDQAIFINELLNMLTLAYNSHKELLISKELDLLLTMVGIPGGGVANPLVERFMEALQDESHPVMFPDDYAKEFGVSLNWLNRVIRRETAQSVSSWIDQTRIGRAKKMLQDTDIPIIDIAVAVGLDDQSYFARFFKRHCGMTPSQFRQLSRNKHG